MAISTASCSISSTVVLYVPFALAINTVLILYVPVAYIPTWRTQAIANHGPTPFVTTADFLPNVACHATKAVSELNMIPQMENAYLRR